VTLLVIMLSFACVSGSVYGCMVNSETGGRQIAEMSNDTQTTSSSMLVQR